MFRWYVNLANIEMSSIDAHQPTTAAISYQQQQQQQQQEYMRAAAHDTTTFYTSPDAYCSYADNFDLSLLPDECDLDLDPCFATDTPNISLDYIPTTVYQHTTTTAADIKIEETWSGNDSNANSKQESSTTAPSPAVIFEQLQQKRHQKVQRTKSQPLSIPSSPYSHPFPTPESSPTQSEYSFHSQFGGKYKSLSSSHSSLYPPSPCSSVDTTHIKQEFHILPPSPPESSCEAPSPHTFSAEIKTEPLDADVEALIDINTLLEHSYQPSYEQPNVTLPTSECKVKLESTPCSQDHQLLREYLEDTSFQKKHNLKPLALESLIGGLGVRGDFEPVISLALEHAKREAEETCARLQISPDPKTWSTKQVHAWLQSTIEQFKLPPIADLEFKFPENGTTLALLSEEEFVRRVPEIGSTIHAQLEIWKLAYSNGFQDVNASTTLTPLSVPQQQCSAAQLQGSSSSSSMWQAKCGQKIEMEVDEGSDVDDDDALPPTSVLTATAATSLASTSHLAASAAASTVAITKPLGATPARNGGSHIHLWQFLKELLAAPHINGTAIRWIDRNKGVFKIEDSVRVAKLWGRRKNRPAMNYDKLSRSIRQYYKKGIMKKTERSQRLVYQFCHPYNL